MKLLAQSNDSPASAGRTGRRSVARGASPWFDGNAKHRSPKGATVAAGYMTIINKGTAADRLKGFSSPASGKFEMHEMSMDNGVMKMRPLPDGIEVKPGATVELKPGSFHLMFVGIKEPFQKGARVKGTLTFEKAGPVEVEFAVEAVGATPKMDHMEHGNMPAHGH